MTGKRNITFGQAEQIRRAVKDAHIGPMRRQRVAVYNKRGLIVRYMVRTVRTTKKPPRGFKQALAAYYGILPSTLSNILARRIYKER